MEWLLTGSSASLTISMEKGKKKKGKRKSETENQLMFNPPEHGDRTDPGCIAGRGPLAADRYEASSSSVLEVTVAAPRGLNTNKRIFFLWLPLLLTQASNPQRAGAEVSPVTLWMISTAGADNPSCPTSGFMQQKTEESLAPRYKNTFFPHLRKPFTSFCSCLCPCRRTFSMQWVGVAPLFD